MQRTATPLTSVRFRSQPPVMKIIITGSSGFIGFSLAKQLLNSQILVTGIDNHSDYYDVGLKQHRRKLLKSNNFKFKLLDVNDISKFDVSNEKFDILIHLAAQAGVRLPKSQHYLYEETNIKGFENICRFCIENSISKVIYASSSSVYSDSEAAKFIEDKTPLAPKSLYGKSKLANENFAHSIYEKFNLKMVGLRFFSVYGPYGRPDMAYYLFSNKIKNNEKVILHNNGEMARDMTFIDDIIDGIEKAIEFINTRTEPCNEIFNLGNDTPIKTSFLLKTLERKFNKNAKIFSTESANESKFTHADLTKARNVLGYVPQVSFSKGIDKFYNWHSEYET